MARTIWLRPLSPEELAHLRKGKGGEMFSSDSLAIIGPADHLYVKCLNVKVRSYRVHLGNGQYIDEATWQDATGGVKISVTWSVNSAYDYLFDQAKNLNIEFFEHPKSSINYQVFVFDKSYIDRFVKAISYADHALRDWYESRPLLTRWFGAMAPEYTSTDAAIIRETLRAILIN